MNHIPWLQWPVPQWPPSFLRVKFWFFKVYKPLHDLSPDPLCLISSTPLPLNPLSLSHSGPGCCSNFQALFWKELIKTSLSQSISLILAIHLYPHHSFFTTLIITWHRIFPTLYCVFSSIIVCMLFSYILFIVVYLLEKTMLSKSKRYILISISQVNDSLFSDSCQVYHHWREWIK